MLDTHEQRKTCLCAHLKKNGVSKTNITIVRKELGAQGKLAREIYQPRGQGKFSLLPNLSLAHRQTLARNVFQYSP